MRLREFPHPNMLNFLCPVCNTSADRPVVLVPLPSGDSNDDGRTVQAQQVHSECYQLAMKMAEACHGVLS